jgi:hypothetical protein
MSSIAFDSQNHSTNTGFGTTLSFTVGAGSNRMLIVAVYEATPAVNTATVTYNSVAMTKIGQQIDSDRAISLWYLIAPTSGTHTVALTGSGSYTIAILAESYSGVNQVAPEASNTATVASASTISASVTTISDESWLVACFVGNAVTLSAGTNTTFRATELTAIVAIGDSNAAQTPAGSYSLAANATGSNNMGMVIASLKAASMVTTLSDSLAMGSLDTLIQVYGFLQTLSDSLAMGSLDAIKSIYGWAKQVKSAAQNWIDQQKS